MKSFTTRRNISHENALIGWGATQFWVLHLPPDTAGKVGTQRDKTCEEMMFTPPYRCVKNRNSQKKHTHTDTDEKANQ